MRFPIILADPAWTYDDKALAGNRGAGCKYDLLDDEGIYSLPVASIAEKDAVLFLWVTMPKLAEGLACIHRWGFTYKTCAFTWVKPNRPFAEWIDVLLSNTRFVTTEVASRVNKPWAIGMGRWTRSNAELCLLATKGKPQRVDAGVNQIVCAPAMKHSAKPPEVRERIVRLCGDIPRVELFARDVPLGWVGLGNEIDGRDLRESVPDLARASTLNGYCPIRGERESPLLSPAA
jgi:N6-adenosine-specific RNA methylase IME4